MKPLFIPLKAEFYDAFKAGTKRRELRLYGARWNEKTCKQGREVIISRGYGKQHRMRGRIWHYHTRRLRACFPNERIAITNCYGYLDLDTRIACFHIEELRTIIDGGREV